MPSEVVLTTPSRHSSTDNVVMMILPVTVVHAYPTPDKATTCPSCVCSIIVCVSCMRVLTEVKALTVLC